MSFISTKEGFKVYYNYLNRSTNKPVLVFIHGWLTNWTCFKKEIDYFKRKHHPVLYIDLRGHGRSSKPNLLKDYRLDAMAEDLDIILKKEHIKKIILIGWSMGGMIALLSCLRHQSRVKRLILIDSSYKNPLFSSKIAYFHKHKKFLKILCLFIIEHTKIKKKHFRHIKQLDFSKMEKYSDIRIFLKAIIHTPLRSTFSALENIFHYNLKKDIAEIRKPTLIIASHNDEFYTERFKKNFAGKIKKSTFDLRSGTHTIIIKMPKEIAIAIENFIE